jgi:hypothetical protein
LGLATGRRTKGLLHREYIQSKYFVYPDIVGASCVWGDTEEIPFFLTLQWKWCLFFRDPGSEFYDMA